MLEFVRAHAEPHLSHLRELFREYADALGFDLSFQDFEEELAGLPGEYAPPHGAALLALQRGEVAGCVALRRIDPRACEMKRLYVRPRFQRRGIGKELAAAIIKQARQSGYQRMRLDTVPWMTAAIELYESLGFQDIKPYRYNPIEGARFMELLLGPFA